jgi:hypothetical protein
MYLNQSYEQDKYCQSRIVVQNKYGLFFAALFVILNLSKGDKKDGSLSSSKPPEMQY